MAEGLYVILASGESLNDETVDYVKLAREDGRLQGVIAVSNVGIDKAPWADALVSHDSAWWLAHPLAMKFKGRKFSSWGAHSTEKFDSRGCGVLNGMNSGLMAMFVAKNIFKAQKLILLGIDMGGTHYFGPHKKLKNSNDKDFKRHIQQFHAFKGCEVINCSLGSRLELFPKANLYDIL